MSINVTCKNFVPLAVKRTTFCLTALHSLVVGKVRELVGEINYAFGWCCSSRARRLAQTSLPWSSYWLVESSLGFAQCDTHW